ncbi:3-deoxy-D-manno-octulosonic acid transferase [Alkalitalea saponilacus]|uniref:3-deoxy-D-manno-octulosonic acid transferase n=1 Tax=Alkalitalea saponilacus TaxID=889453 RepID=A0A1T5FNF1_9BACT|nr:glycosyltransferase N-terminal domain-containing protein [Alkalitalea saponilacus]ASB49448.1 3-deoxy-D-manno-octulosonic acid transferase [Alkalitalea saponilacus]SKB97652.1 3-deoxy-D-manno-octulosonic-acid transferase [Alkalitalea saponilacus]
MRILYDIGIQFYHFMAKLLSPFNKQASMLSRGRSEVWDKIDSLALKDEVIWVHCASLGEFEQGRPLIEAIRAKKPDWFIVLTFFSPSGYEIRKNYEMADAILYLPADTKSNARRFISAIKPKAVFFVKYEFWFYYFKELNQANIPLYSVSSIFRENQIFFKWYGSWFRKTLEYVTKFYVQDEKSGQLLTSFGMNNFVVAGDTRFDRVASIAKAAADVPLADTFARGAKVLVAGSTWPPDEEILSSYINQSPASEKFIIAPHQIHDSHIKQIEERLSVPTVRYTKTDIGKMPAETKVLIIDTIGMLSAIYRYGSVAYIGGGFGKGIHNTLEAATYGMPVIFGPNYKKFKEAVDLINEGGGFAIKDEKDFFGLMQKIWDNNEGNLLENSGKAAASYVNRMLGATEKIINEQL